MKLKQLCSATWNWQYCRMGWGERIVQWFGTGGLGTAVFAANFVTIGVFIPSEKVLNKSELLTTSLLVAWPFSNDSYF